MDTLSARSMERPLPFAYARPWPFADQLDLKRYPALSGARAFSVGKLADIRRGLEGVGQAAPVVETIALVGSLGRLEAHHDSDFDIVVVTSDDVSPDSERAQQARDAVFARVAATGFRKPQRWDIYSEPASKRLLCNPADLGSLDESPSVFGKRIQLLLEAQPVYGDTSFRELQRSVLDWYATGFVSKSPQAEWVYLLNDLIRYFRSYAAWQQFKLLSEPASTWLSRIAKMKHSRVLTYAGLLLLLGECSTERDNKVDWLSEHLALTPLERIAFVYQNSKEEDGLGRIVEAYERFLAVWIDPQARKALMEGSPTSLAELPPTDKQVYEEISHAADDLKDELVRFILARRERWSPAFFRYLWF